MESPSEHSPTLNAPGCYASPSVFSHDSVVCQGCPAFDACSSACIETLQALREKINVEDIINRHRRAKASTIESAQPAVAKPDYSKFLPSVRKPEVKVERKPERVKVDAATELTPEQEAIIAGLKQNSQALARKWIKNGLLGLIRSELQAGRSPFASQARHNHESVVCDELLKGTVTKLSLKKAFMARLGNKQPWDESTAASHVGIALPVLVAFNIAVETEEGYALNPRTNNDNDA